MQDFWVLLFCATGAIARLVEASDIQVVHLETGKAVAKTARAAMKNGNCQWQDPDVESMQLQFDQTTNEYEENFYKLSSSFFFCHSGLLRTFVPSSYTQLFWRTKCGSELIDCGLSFPVMFSLNVPHNKGSNCR